jgi:HAD superfamily hydrolase (TIGR01490 family)
MYRNLALFDLDHTLLPIDSDFEWGEFLGRKGVVAIDAYRAQNAVFYQQYSAGTLDIFAFLQFALEPLARLDRRRAEDLHRDYMREVIRPQIRPAAQTLVNDHKAMGDLCAVVTATNAFVTAPIALAFGVEHLVATVPAQTDGAFTGAVRGTPCYREGKIVRVAEWLETMGRSWGSFERITFYSDSHNDLALLSHVTDPVATNADGLLQAEAARRGWRSLALFNDH